MNLNVSNGKHLSNIVNANHDFNSGNKVINLINKYKNEHFINFNSAPKEQSKADLFDDWTNSEENNEKLLQRCEAYQALLENKDADADIYNTVYNNDDIEIEEFEMFDNFDLKTYSSDIKEFAQNYINKFDENGDGTFDRAEFIKMARGNMEISKEDEKENEALLNQKFDDLNIDDDTEHISAEEYASMLYTADLDWANYKEDEVGKYLDGKLNYAQFAIAPNSKDDARANWMSQKEAFFNNFYKKDEETVETKEPEKSKESANTSNKVDYTFTTPGGKEISINVPDGWNDMTEDGNKIIFTYPDGSKRTIIM